MRNDKKNFTWFKRTLILCLVLLMVLGLVTPALSRAESLDMNSEPISESVETEVGGTGQEAVENTISRETDAPPAIEETFSPTEEVTEPQQTAAQTETEEQVSNENTDDSTESMTESSESENSESSTTESTQSEPVENQSESTSTESNTETLNDEEPTTNKEKLNDAVEPDNSPEIFDDVSNDMGSPETDEVFDVPFMLRYSEEGYDDIEGGSFIIKEISETELIECKMQDVEGERYSLSDKMHFYNPGTYAIIQKEKTAGYTGFDEPEQVIVNSDGTITYKNKVLDYNDTLECTVIQMKDKAKDYNLTLGIINESGECISNAQLSLSKDATGTEELYNW